MGASYAPAAPHGGCRFERQTLTPHRGLLWSARAADVITGLLVPLPRAEFPLHISPAEAVDLARHGVTMSDDDSSVGAKPAHLSAECHIR